MISDTEIKLAIERMMDLIKPYPIYYKIGEDFNITDNINTVFKKINNMVSIPVPRVQVYEEDFGYKYAKGVVASNLNNQPTLAIHLAYSDSHIGIPRNDILVLRKKGDEFIYDFYTTDKKFDEDYKVRLFTTDNIIEAPTDNDWMAETLVSVHYMSATKRERPKATNCTWLLGMHSSMVSEVRGGENNLPQWFTKDFRYKIEEILTLRGGNKKWELQQILSK